MSDNMRKRIFDDKKNRIITGSRATLTPNPTARSTFIVPRLVRQGGACVHVVDGDTIDVEKDGRQVRVRLYGIDTPESKQWYGQNATAFTSAQVIDRRHNRVCEGMKVAMKIL